eukprot:5903904-Prymnesium_polylepis.1
MCAWGGVHGAAQSPHWTLVSVPGCLGGCGGRCMAVEKRCASGGASHLCGRGCSRETARANEMGSCGGVGGVRSGCTTEHHGSDLRLRCGWTSYRGGSPPRVTSFTLFTPRLIVYPEPLPRPLRVSVSKIQGWNYIGNLLVLKRFGNKLLFRPACSKTIQ